MKAQSVRAIEALLKGGNHLLDHSEHTPLYENEQKRKENNIVETTLLLKLLVANLLMAKIYVWNLFYEIFIKCNNRHCQFL